MHGELPFEEPPLHSHQVLVDLVATRDGVQGEHAPLVRLAPRRDSNAGLKQAGPGRRASPGVGGATQGSGRRRVTRWRGVGAALVCLQERLRPESVHGAAEKGRRPRRAHDFIPRIGDGVDGALFGLGLLQVGDGPRDARWHAAAHACCRPVRDEAAPVDPKRELHRGSLELGVSGGEDTERAQGAQSRMAGQESRGARTHWWSRLSKPLVRAGCGFRSRRRGGHRRANCNSVLLPLES
mmetsp:Transcript_16537/g.34927  ORF Transcript_16537/g.34927 Transcript_16537/m.34927 type:complete len:239 (-) Transcript_16537:1495-2211(-)